MFINLCIQVLECFLQASNKYGAVGGGKEFQCTLKQPLIEQISETSHVSASLHGLTESDSKILPLLTTLVGKVHKMLIVGVNHITAQNIVISFLNNPDSIPAYFLVCWC